MDEEEIEIFLKRFSDAIVEEMDITEKIEIKINGKIFAILDRMPEQGRMN